MEIHNIPPYDAYKTVLQWAKLGKVPIDPAQGIELWHNRHCQGHGLYYAPDMVREGTPKELDVTLGPRRERKRLQEAVRKERKRQQEAAYHARQLEEVKAEAVYEAIHNLFEKSLARLDRNVPPMGKPIVIDTETTGLEDDDELLQVSIIDIDGCTLYNSYIRPYHHEIWPEAQQINNISPQTVEKAPYLHEVALDIGKIVVNSPMIIGYNTDFDLGFLSHCGAIRPNNQAEYFDVMYAYAENYTDDGRWRKLKECADYFGYDWSTGGPHDSLEDARATLYCYKQICADWQRGE